MSRMVGGVRARCPSSESAPQTPLRRSPPSVTRPGSVTHPPPLFHSFCCPRCCFSARSDRIDASEKELTTQQQKHRDEIMKIQETAKQVQQAAVAKQTQAQQLADSQ